MRTFSYSTLPDELKTREVRDRVTALYEAKGRLSLLFSSHPEVFSRLERQARLDAVVSSLLIEGIPIDRSRVPSLLAGDIPAENDLDNQIVGYARAWDSILSGWGDMNLSSATIVHLYETLFQGRNLGTRSRYRRKDQIYTMVNGQPQPVQVSPINAFETPLVLGGACDSLAEAFDQSDTSPLVMAAVFTVDFLCIRPFDEGNGRIIRLFSQLVLEKAGIDLQRYVSIDRMIAQSPSQYYDALNECAEGWDSNSGTYLPYLEYWLALLEQSTDELFSAIDREVNGPSGKSDKVLAFIMSCAGKITKQQIRESCPDVSISTIENMLGKLVREGALEKTGAGRSTSYKLVSR